MKLFLILLGMAVAGTVGYWLEPQLRETVTGTQATTPQAAINPSAKSPVPPITDLDPATLAPEQLPKEVALKAAVNFSDETSGLTMTLAVGSHAKLVRIDGSNAVVRPGSTAYTVTVPISGTDLLEQLAANPPPPVTPKAPDAPANGTPDAPAPSAPAAEAPPVEKPVETAPSVEPTPPPAAIDSPVTDTPTPAAEPETAPTAAPMTEPQAPEPAETPATTEVPSTPAPAEIPSTPPTVANTPASVVRVMQESIRQAQIKEFTFDQVLSWKAGADETIDGSLHQTGLVSYRAETIFGVKTIQAKAIILNGKVQRWIWPKSGMEIK